MSQREPRESQGWPAPLAEAVATLGDDQSQAFLTLMVDRIVGGLEKTLPDKLENALRQVGYTDEVSGLVRLLASRSGDTKEQVIRKALTLYGLALDYVEKGDRVVILDAEDTIVREIEGFGGPPVPLHGELAAAVK